MSSNIPGSPDFNAGATPRPAPARRGRRLALAAILALALFALVSGVRDRRPALRFQQGMEALRVSGMPTRPSELTRWFPRMPPGLDLPSRMEGLAGSGGAPGVAQDFQSLDVLVSGECRDGWTPEAWSVCEAEVRAHLPVAEALLELDLAGCGFGQPIRESAERLENPLEDWVFARIQLARLLAVFAVHEAEPCVGRPDRAVAALERGYQLAWVPSPTGGLAMIGRVACESMLREALVQVLRRASLDEGLRERLDRALTRPSDQRWRELIAERALVLWSADAPVESVAGLPPGWNWGRVWWRLTGPMRGYQSRVQLLEDLNLMVDSGSLPFRERVERAAREEAQRGMGPARVRSPWWRVRRALDADLLVTEMVRSQRAGLFIQDAVNEGTLVSARVALGVERWRAGRGGKVPVSLEEVGVGCLGAEPRDPWDGRPLRYVTSARGYRVYSVGPDGVDQGGVWMSRGSMSPGDAGLEMGTGG